MFPDFTSVKLETISKTPDDVIDKPTQWISVSQNIRSAACQMLITTNSALPMLILGEPKL